MDNFLIIIGFSLVMVVMGFIAVISHLKSKDLSSFFVASRGSKWYLIVGSLLASGISGSAFFGMVAFYYDLGMPIFWINAGIAWSYFILCFFVGPRLRRFGKITISDYLAERFDSPALRPTFSIIVSLWMIILLGTLYVQGGLLFSQMFGWDYATSSIMTSVLVIVFTVFGGMVVVMNSDLLAMIVLTLALLIALPLILNSAGGWTEVASTVSATQPEYFTSSGTTTAIMAFSWFFIWCFGYLGNPGFLTRFYAAKNEREIIKSGIGISLIYVPVYSIVFFSAASAKLLYPSVADSELIWITYMYEFTPPLIIGIAMAGVFASILSSANSWLLAGATSLGRDIYQKTFKKDVSDNKVLMITKLLIIIIGALAVPIGIWRPAYIMEMMNIAYFVAGSTGGVVILMSMYYKNMTKEGAWAGLITGGIIAIGWRTLQIVGLLTDTIDPMIPTLILSLLTIVIVSKLTKPSAKMISFYNRLSGSADTHEKAS
ncbi:sodium:solute symporter family protein [Thalassobacillus devorans]|uniref:sodium:solute symporter family protein n=1 Tax=Thalassobacillus devorans TaxID=279813 RepID=UPI000A1CEC67|nr:hypothetical protein [Thalassobacillus devorans]